VNARREAIFALSLWQTQGTFPTQALANSPVYGNALEIVGAVLRHLASLNWVVKQCVQRMPTGELSIALLVGAAQLLYLPKMAEYAAIDETVEAAKQISKSAGAFVNAVLRRIQREKPLLLAKLAEQPEALQRNLPRALWRRWVETFGLEQAREISNAIESPPRTTLQPLPPYAFDASFEPHPLCSTAALLPNGQRVEAMPGFVEGQWIVQDIATQTAVEWLEVSPGLSILDACAAPGGKTAQIAARLEGQGILIANEPSRVRRARLLDTLKRCRFDSFVRIDGEDATVASWPQMDRILLDVPCSNTGVFGRRPDARWSWSCDKMASLLETQRALLDHAATLLAPNGILVYSTCSIEPEEDQRQVEDFLSRHSDWVCVKTQLKLPTVWNDGSFCAQLRRK
jgi:16S rRNA (cytosine967-C5)-methyltransferase